MSYGSVRIVVERMQSGVRVIRRIKSAGNFSEMNAYTATLSDDLHQIIFKKGEQISDILLSDISTAQPTTEGNAAAINMEISTDVTMTLIFPKSDDRDVWLEGISLLGKVAALRKHRELSDSQIDSQVNSQVDSHVDSHVGHSNGQSNPVSKPEMANDESDLEEGVYEDPSEEECEDDRQTFPKNSDALLSHLECLLLTNKSLKGKISDLENHVEFLSIQSQEKEQEISQWEDLAGKLLEKIESLNSQATARDQINKQAIIKASEKHREFSDQIISLTAELESSEMNLKASQSQAADFEKENQQISNYVEILETENSKLKDALISREQTVDNLVNMVQQLLGKEKQSVNLLIEKSVSQSVSQNQSFISTHSPVIDAENFDQKNVQQPEEPTNSSSVKSTDQEDRQDELGLHALLKSLEERLSSMSPDVNLQTDLEQKLAFLEAKRQRLEAMLAETLE